MDLDRYKYIAYVQKLWCFYSTDQNKSPKCIFALTVSRNLQLILEGWMCHHKGCMEEVSARSQTETSLNQNCSLHQLNPLVKAKSGEMLRPLKSYLAHFQRI